MLYKGARSTGGSGRPAAAGVEIMGAEGLKNERQRAGCRDIDSSGSIKATLAWNSMPSLRWQDMINEAY